MADEPNELELAEARLIVAAACAAAGKAENVPAWKGRVNVLIPEVAAMLGDRSWQVKRALMMTSAVVFTAEFISFEAEESSQRYIVWLKHHVDNDHPDGRQAIRTERFDSPPGKAMLAHLENVRAGNTLLCWKVLEPMKKNPNRKAAVLMHVEVLPDRAKDADDSPTPSGDRQQPRREPSPTPPPAGAPSIEETLAHWSATMTKDQKIAAVERCKAEGIWPMTEDNQDRVLLIMTEESKK